MKVQFQNRGNAGRETWVSRRCLVAKKMSAAPRTRKTAGYSAPATARANTAKLTPADPAMKANRIVSSR